MTDALVPDPPPVADVPERWPVEHTQTSYIGPVITLRHDVIRSPVDDSRFTRDVIVHPGGVSALAVDDHDRALVIHQYRHPVGYRTVEIPAGLRDVHGEPPHDTAARELYEEAHVRAASWRVLVDMFPSVGASSQAHRIYLARDLTEVPHDERHVGEHEEADLHITWVPLADLVDAVLAGRLQHAQLCAAVLAAWTVRHGAGYDTLRPADAPWPGGVPVEER
jgi:8-oxo-dGDP phosphatase